MWNQKTRDELREAVVSEVREVRRAQSLASDGARIVWNHKEFETDYASLRDELKVGEVYLRLLLDGGQPPVRHLQMAGSAPLPLPVCRRLRRPLDP